MTIVRTSYRYKRPPKKRKAKFDEVPPIVTARNPRRRAVPDVPDMTPEEHQRRGNAAVALCRKIITAAKPDH